MSVFASKMKALRKRYRYTQEDLSKIVGVSSRSIKAYETDEKFPRNDTLWKIAAALKVSSKYLTDDECTDELADLEADPYYRIVTKDKDRENKEKWEIIRDNLIRVLSGPFDDESDRDAFFIRLCVIQIDYLNKCNAKLKEENEMLRAHEEIENGWGVMEISPNLPKSEKDKLILKRYNKIYSLALKLKLEHKTSDPFELCKALGIKIKKESYGTQPDSLKGAMRAYDDDAEIIVNVDLDEAHQKSMVAHELGHYFLHRKKAGGEKLDTMLFDRKKAIEREADLFAAEILMFDEEFFGRFNELKNIYSDMAEALNIPFDTVDYKAQSLKIRRGMHIQHPKEKETDDKVAEENSTDKKTK